MKVDKAQFYSSNKRHLQDMVSYKSLPLSSYPMTRNYNPYYERPLKNISDELSFKGLSFNGENASGNEVKKHKSINPTIVLLGILGAAGVALRLAPSYKQAVKFNISEFKKFTSKYMENIGGDLFEHLKKSKLSQKMLKIVGDEAIIYKKTIPQLIWDGLKYPFTILPGDLLNGSVEMLGKIKPLNKWSENLLSKPLFKNIRQRSKLDAKMNALQGLVETQQKLSSKLAKGELTEVEVSSEMFQKSVKMFDKEKYGAYDTKHERALNRLVSGLPPAIFLANDAYNLSRVMDDDPKKADKEKKIRFNQEATRILTSGYLTLITLGALNKYINNSKFGIMLMTGGTVLFTEVFSRLANGKFIKRLTPEEARLENEKNNAPEKEIKPDTSFKANSEFKKSSEKNQQKPLLTFNTLMKASAVVIAAGFGIKGLRKLKPVDDMFRIVQEPFQKLYKKLTVIPDYTITKDNFDKIINVLNDNGYKDLAAKYQNIAASVADSKGIIHLGAKNRKYIKPAVNFVIAPFKFVYNTVTLPYRLADKAVKMFVPKPHPSVKTAEQLAKELSKKDVEILAKTIENIGKEAVKKGMTPKQFQSYVNDNILKAFNVTTMSNLSNSELSNLAKTAASAATIWFLMTDNYNMVMLKSNGNDKDGAETKFKERFVQEISRLFYQTLLIDLFNSTFKSQYNGSLAGMSWVTLVDTTLGEILTRKSVGMPVFVHTRDELEAIEKKQNEATGFVKGYYNFMRRLTGKRSIESYHVEKESPVNEVVPKSDKSEMHLNFTNNRPIFTQMIKG